MHFSLHFVSIPTFLVSGDIQAKILDKGLKDVFDGHGLMNRYRTLTLKEINKLPKLVLCSRNVLKLRMCGVT